MIMVVVALCATLWAAPCISDSGCESTCRHTLASWGTAPRAWGMPLAGGGVNCLEDRTIMVSRTVPVRTAYGLRAG